MKKEIDCVRMKNEIQQQILREIEGMSDAHKLEYYHSLARESGGLWEKVKAAPPPPLWVQQRRQSMLAPPEEPE